MSLATSRLGESILAINCGMTYHVHNDYTHTPLCMYSICHITWSQFSISTVFIPSVSALLTLGMCP